MTIDELEAQGAEAMDTAAIYEFLAEQDVGVLGIPTERLPYMVPISYAFDGDENLYFTYVVGQTSQKALLSEESDAASFLIYDTVSETDWTSVRLDGTLTRVSESELESLADSLESVWRPEAMKNAMESEDTRVYRFWIQNESGIRQA